MKDGLSATRIEVFLNALPVAKAVANVASSVCSPRTISSSGITATGLKKWKPTTRCGCSSCEAISVIDSDEVFVASTHVGDTTRLQVGEDPLLDRHLLEDGLDHEVGVREGRRGVDRAGDEGLQPVGPVGGDPALGEQLVDLGVHVADALVDPCLVEVGQDHGHLQAPYEQQRELAGHQSGADDADLGDRAGQRLVRRTRRPLGALLHEVEGVEARGQLRGEDQVGQRLVLGGEALVAGGGPWRRRSGRAHGTPRGRRHRSSRPRRRGRAPRPRPRPHPGRLGARWA